MYDILAMIALVLALFFIVKMIRNLHARVDRLEQDAQQIAALQERIGALEDHVFAMQVQATPSAAEQAFKIVLQSTMPDIVDDGGSVSDGVPSASVTEITGESDGESEKADAVAATGDESPQAVTDVITIIDDIDEEARNLRKELRRRKLPVRGTIEEMRARLSTAPAPKKKKPVEQPVTAELLPEQPAP